MCGRTRRKPFSGRLWKAKAAGTALGACGQYESLQPGSKLPCWSPSVTPQECCEAVGAGSTRVRCFFDEAQAEHCCHSRLPVHLLLRGWSRSRWQASRRYRTMVHTDTTASQPRVPSCALSLSPPWRHWRRHLLRCIWRPVDNPMQAQAAGLGLVPQERRRLVLVEAPVSMRHLFATVSVSVSIGGSLRRAKSWLEEFFPHLDLCPLVREVLVDNRALRRFAPQRALTSGRLRSLPHNDRSDAVVGGRLALAASLRSSFVVFLSDDTGYDCPTILKLLVVAGRFPGRLIGPWNAGRGVLPAPEREGALYSFNQWGALLLDRGLLVPSALLHIFHWGLPRRLKVLATSIGGDGCQVLLLNWLASYLQSDAEGAVSILFARPLVWHDLEAGVRLDPAWLSRQDACVTMLYRRLSANCGWPVPAALRFARVEEPEWWQQRP